ncbi:MAG: hypothetical protein WC256_10795, partial [Desulfurivibrionaceae bacterium]
AREIIGRGSRINFCGGETQVNFLISRSLTIIFVPCKEISPPVCGAWVYQPGLSSPTTLITVE